MLAAFAGKGGSSLTGFTLKSELLHAAVRIAKQPSASDTAFRQFGNIARFIKV